MILDYDLDVGLVVSGTGSREPIPQLTFKRDTDTEIQIRFWRNFVRVELSPGSNGKLVVKPVGSFDSAPLALCETWTQTGTGSEAIYAFETNFSGAALASLLASDGIIGNDLTRIEAMSEIVWETEGKKRRSQTIYTIIANDVLKDEDFSPTPLPSPIGSTAPTNGVAGTLLIDPPGADNSILITAIQSGGNEISVEIAPIAASSSNVVAVTDKSIVVTPASMRQTSTATNLQWRSVKSSADGTKLAATATGSTIFTSTDSGATWVARETSRAWRGIASSDDGNNLVAAVAGGFLYTSTNSGVTWTQRDSSRNWISVASSSDGTKLLAAVSNGFLYTSTNSGVTWTQRDSSRLWTSVASSANGNHLVAVANNHQIYTSSDSGVTWVARDTARNWFAVTCSADGSMMGAVVSGGQIYISSDSGATWTARETSRSWRSITCSANGQIIVAVATSTAVYRSDNGGVTWFATGQTRLWWDIAANASGDRFVGVPESGNIILIGPGTADQIIAAINANSQAAALVSASASGLSTGTITQPVPEVHLSGGIPATMAPPYIRVADGNLYIQESGIWKKTALSAL
jgi:hypothetical protein